MKRILLVNKFYYPFGGDCLYTLNLESLLQKQGHEVAVFAQESPRNLSSKWSSYFPSEVSYSLKNPSGLLATFSRPMGSEEVKMKFLRLLDDFQPDVVHLNNIHTHLSPVIARIASEKGIKVIWTLHDYKLLCPRSDCLRQGKSSCEKCYDSKANVIRYRCTHGSFPASFLAYMEALKWSRKKLESYTARFICPSHFMKSRMQRGHFDENKLCVLHNFIDTSKVKRDSYTKSDYYCYVGRISVEKGLKTLLNAASGLSFRLKVVGDGPQLHDLKSCYKQENIEFFGKQDWTAIKEIVGNARFSVIPSEWYENNPLSVIESLCLGTPVIGAKNGGIPELIENGVTGCLFEPGNMDDLKKKIISLYEKENSESDYRLIAEKSQQAFSEKIHYEALIKIYEEPC